MLDTTTKKRIEDCRDILVGKLPDPKAQIEQITIALIYKFMDDMDKETIELGGKAKFFSGDYAKYAWDKLFDSKLQSHDMLKLYADAIESMELNPNIPQLFRDIFKNAYLPYRDPQTLKMFLKTISEFEYSHSEKLGDAFEYLLSVMGSQGDAGQFRTPRHIIDFMVEIVKPQKHETILDPACGTSGFLIASYKYIIKNNSSNYKPEQETKTFETKNKSVEELTLNGTRYKGDKLTPDDRKKLGNNIKGYDISPDMVRMSLVNMYLHGIQDPHIDEYDTLTSEERWNEQADIILANPPFMSPKGGIRPHKRFSVQSNRSEVLFVNYIAEHLNIKGRAAVIVPEGIIFQSGKAYKELRKILVENYLWGVISLPAGVFNPYSGVKTSILLMDKELVKKTDKLLFIKIENDGFALGAQRKPIGGSQLPETIQLLEQYTQLASHSEPGSHSEQGSHSELVSESQPLTQLLEKHQSLAHIVDKEKIAESGEYNLSGERYKEIQAINSDYPLVKLKDICTIQSGGTPSRKEPTFWNGDIPWIGSGVCKNSIVTKADEYITPDGLNSSSAKLFKKNTSLIALVGATIGKTGLLTFDCTTNQNIAGLYPNDLAKLDPKYLFIALQNLYSHFMSLGEGKFRMASLSFVRELEIPLPPLEVQKELVAEIESYQKIIDGARMVVDNYKPQIKIDPEWGMVELGNVCEIIMGQSPSGDSYNMQGVGVPLINGPVEFGPEPFSKTIKRQYTTEPTKMCKKGDLILCVRGSTTGRMNISGFDACIGRGVAAIRSELYQGWINQYTNIIRAKLYSLGSGSTFPNITSKTLKTLKIPIPPQEIQKQVVTQIEKEQELVNANKQLIDIYEQKIKDRINEVWDTSPKHSTKNYTAKENEMDMAAES